MADRLDYAREVLVALGVPHRDAMRLEHRGAWRALVAIGHAESGENPGACNGKPGEGAAWNLLNTTEQMEGAAIYFNQDGTPNSVGVKNYVSLGQGAQAVAATLEGDTRYKPVLDLLLKPNPNAKAIIDAWAASPWGPVDKVKYRILLEGALKAYQRDRSFFNHYPIGV